MHIRKLIFAAALCLGVTAFAPLAMADPAPDICVLDLSQPVAIEHALDTADMVCAASVALDVAEAVPILGASGNPAAATCSKLIVASTSEYAGHRQHFDPGRCAT